MEIRIRGHNTHSRLRPVDGVLYSVLPVYDTGGRMIWVRYNTSFFTTHDPDIDFYVGT